jgi:hypothetical protein
MNGKLKNAEAFKAGSRPAPSVRQSDILELEKTDSRLGEDGMNGGSNLGASYDEPANFRISQGNARQRCK